MEKEEIWQLSNGTAIVERKNDEEDIAGGIAGLHS